MDTWWQTETGAIMISPLPGVTPTKPGSATFPFFGVDAAIVNEKGEELGVNQGGFLVIKQPWPSMLRTLYGADDRFKDVYWSRFAKQGWYLAGDGAVQGRRRLHLDPGPHRRRAQRFRPSPLHHGSGKRPGGP